MDRKIALSVAGLLCWRTLTLVSPAPLVGQDNRSYSQDLKKSTGEPLTGPEAKIANTSKIDHANVAFENGLLRLVAIGEKEGIRRAQKLDDDSGFRVLNEARTKLNSCFGRAEIQRQTCYKDDTTIDGAVEPVLQGGCLIKKQQSQADCIVDFVVTLKKIPDIQCKDRLREQQDIASRSALHLEAVGESMALLPAVNALGRGLFDEVGRVVLDQYAEYGVPTGPTLLATAWDNYLKCTQRATSQSIKCYDSLTDNFPDDVRIQASIEGLPGPEAGAVIACGTVLTVDASVCAGDNLYKRLCVAIPLIGALCK